MTTSLLNSLSAAWTEFLGRLREIVPDLLVLGAILLAGIVAGVATRWIVGRALRVLRFDALADRTGLTATLRRAGLGGLPGQSASRFVGWGVFLLFVLAGAASLRIPGTQNLVARAFEFLPALVAAGFVLVAGLMLAQFLSRATLVAAVNAEVASARLLAGGVRGLLVVLTVAMTLEQLGVARGIVTAAFSILFGGVVLALAVAFGLGGRHLARRFLESRFPLPPRRKAGTELDHL